MGIRGTQNVMRAEKAIRSVASVFLWCQGFGTDECPSISLAKIKRLSFFHKTRPNHYKCLRKPALQPGSAEAALAPKPCGSSPPFMGPN